MEERRTAAWVLGIIALIVICLAVVLPKAKHLGTQTLSFKRCVVNYVYWDKDYESDIYRAAQNELGLCLCSLYRQKPDTLLKKRIIQIYRLYGNHYAYDSTLINRNIDSIIKHKSMVLDTVVIVE